MWNRVMIGNRLLARSNESGRWALAYLTTQSTFRCQIQATLTQGPRVTATPPSGGSPLRSAATDSGEVFRDAVRYWEVRRIWYNLILLGFAVAWVVGTWPHFRPAFNLASLVKMLVLAALANVCYSAAYLV